MTSQNTYSPRVNDYAKWWSTTFKDCNLWKVLDQGLANCHHNDGSRFCGHERCPIREGKA